MTEEEIQGWKLLITYDIETGKLEEYYQFVLGYYVPVLQTMGLEMSEAWHTAYGNWPNRLVGFVARDWETVNEVLEGETWLTLNEQLAEYVTDFHYKVIPFQEGFQL